ncbi:NurA domain-containing protein [Caldisphaera lagunensis DSM 15908]|uniref:NurA domain-containing protein n=1 Tax=Caldisphaera lagunensis (strain DSM 15908 / JCM 11604 / ANMR 0165 / IC-154) TaxID=1056495 RepID=L0A829_CALLD|nr:NurA domain-containing protein [Caldisphaera lagunensis DSM 15908]
MNLDMPTKIINSLGNDIISSYKTSYSKKRFLLTLKDIIEEDVNENETKAELYEYSSRFFNSKKIVNDKNLFVIGLDSSSRAIITPIADIIISAVSISGQGPVELSDWPYLYRDLAYIPINPEPFIYVASDDLNVSDYSNEYIKQFRSLDNEDDLSKIMDYSRLSLESWGIKEPSFALGNYFKRKGKKFVLLLDGPIYLLDNKNDYIKSNLMKNRSNEIEILENQGIPVIGVVKRIERSKILTNVQDFSNILSQCIGNYETLNDSLIIQKMLYSNCYNNYYGKILTTPKIKVRSNGLDKIVEYVLIPPSRYQSINKGRIFRLEYTEKTLDILNNNYSLEPVQILINDSIFKQSNESITIAYSDKRGKMITQILKDLFINTIVGRGAPISYDTLREAEATWIKRKT